MEKFVNAFFFILISVLIIAMHVVGYLILTRENEEKIVVIKTKELVKPDLQIVESNDVSDSTYIYSFRESVLK